ncbi:MAG TPA: Maf family nucleotide pyrophosphatase [Gammaproteobacteria bacterium]|nr:Maf family nucleotide pyrophosphatase [Gammaproteobacteria bacterium]
MSHERRIILASGSPYRRQLLERLELAFEVHPADIDESGRAGESPDALVLRLSCAKAAAVAGAHPGALIIGSDQVAEIDGRALGKPGGHEGALDQLARLSGRRVRFLTGVCLLDARGGDRDSCSVATEVVFRELAPTEIERYVTRERPYDCAGSFRSEALGISLFRAVHGDDPTALMGLPLIRLAEMLRARGVRVP